MRFTWDPKKAKANFRKHHVSFEESRDVFRDPLAVHFEDTPHSWDEGRMGVIGLTLGGRLLKVIYTIHEDDVHLIHSREAIPFERRRYTNMNIDRLYDEPLPEFDEDDIDTTKVDWSKAVRGKMLIPRRTGTVTIAEDVFDIFQTDDEVNGALRMLIKEGRIPHFPLCGKH